MKSGHIKNKIAEMVQDRIKTYEPDEKKEASMLDEDHADGTGAERTNLNEGLMNHVVGGGRPGSPTPPHNRDDLGVSDIR